MTEGSDGSPDRSAPTTGYLLRSLARVLVAPVGLLVLYSLAPLDGSRWPLGAGLGAAGVLAVLPLSIHQVRVIDRSERPVATAVGAIALLSSMLVFGFAIIYFAVSVHTDQLPAMHTRIDALYFTVTTLATVGFGDIVAVGQGARALVTFQIVLNLILIGASFRMIGNRATRRQRRGEPGVGAERRPTGRAGCASRRRRGPER